MNEERYCGPCSLREALDAAEPHPSTGMRLAVSTPHGTLIAVQIDEDVIIRRVNNFVPKGSVLDTGQWDHYAPSTVTWRPA